MASFNRVSLYKRNTMPLRALGFALVFFLIALLLNLLSPKIKNAFSAVSLPVEQRVWTAGQTSSGFFSSFMRAGSLNRENDALRQENQKLIAQIITLQSIQNANQAQTDISLNTHANSFSLVMAGVVGLDGGDFLALNKGSAEGIAVGMPVVNQQNVLVGVVNAAYRHYSEVMLITNKKSVINVKILSVEDPSQVTTGVLKGQGGKLSLELVPVENPIQSNDLVASSSAENAFPKDIIIGTVGEVFRNDQQPFQRAAVSPIVDISSTENLFVITNFKQPAD